MAKKKKQVKTGSTPGTHFIGVDPKLKQGKKDPCRHKRNKKKERFVVYMAPEQSKGKDTGNVYVGRTRGTGTVEDIVKKRDAGHHRTDIGDLGAVCEHDTYAACRGAEHLHYEHEKTAGRVISRKKKKGEKGTGVQIAPISKKNPNRKDYIACAKASAENSDPPCKICAAGGT